MSLSKFTLKENTTCLESPFLTTVEVSLVNNTLTFTFDCKNSRFNSYSSKYNDELWRSDVVEVFLATKKGDHYYEIEVAPNNTLFLGDITNINNDLSLKFLDNTFIKHNVVINGDDYKATIEIDLSSLDREILEFNCFRIETQGDNSSQTLIALSPTLCESFHRRDKFIHL